MSGLARRDARFPLREAGRADHAKHGGRGGRVVSFPEGDR
jgi:hypothetical protein